MRRIAIVGAGQSGAQLALGLLGHGYQVTLVSERSADQLRTGPVLSSQCMFETAQQAERELGLSLWDEHCPPVGAVSFTLAGDGGSRVSPEPRLRWRAALDAPAQSVDQRLKISTWLTLFAENGGQLVHTTASVADVEQLGADHDLVIIAAGTGGIGRLFRRDDSRSPFRKPQRSLALTYVTGMRPSPDGADLSFSTVPGIGEYFSFPALTASGPCDIMCFEGIPGGPMDYWDSVTTPEEHLAESQWILERFFPWEAERCAGVRLTDPGGMLRGRVTPTVRHPVGVLPSGARVLGLGDVVVLNDPVTGQGANTAAKAASFYLDAIVAHGDGDFDDDWMTATFERYWRGWAKWVTEWTNAFLAPAPPHVLDLLGAAARLPGLASVLANGFDDPKTFFPWWFDATETRRLVATHAAASEAPFDRRELRRALGQYATGVTVVTCRGSDGAPVGMTANSFTSVSLDPPLVLWCPSKTASSTPVFQEASHFTVNVLSSGQHDLSRQFATTDSEKFTGVETREGLGGAPVLEGSVATFECRTEAVHDAGDHLIMVGEVERFDAPGGAPLVFHSGFYHLATRHPDV
ncbi:MAG TPA: styrene monooxygenase/indole monooxygenase family protein [Trebonia sp.]|jgi:flavin reductase (DIM6/NTAB) family NADH-FMN oxidoreductase RutF/2-polyprenyl-6-methoxyphenol hydroxylase-like FAD-dependent oxidoreductase